MSTLLSLPNEILLQIIEETRPDSIRSFARICKKIWTSSAAALEQHQRDLERYQAPVFGVWNDNLGCDVNPYAYLCEILLKPRRALYVNHLFVFNRGFTLTHIRSAAFTEKLLTTIEDLCSLFFKGLGCPYIQGDEISAWVEKLRRGDTNAAACLFLTLLPNLEALSIIDYSNQGYAELIYEISKANQSPHRMIQGPLPLNKLATIMINDTTSMTQPGEKFGIYEACMTLPSLRVLKGTNIDSHFDRWPPGEDIALQSNVTEISFCNSAINAESFSRLLARTKALRRLTYGFARLPGISGDYTATGLKRALEQHTSPTLTHLKLSFNGCPFDDGRRFVGSLRRLRMLEHLRIQGNMFVDHSAGHGDPHRRVDLLPLLPASIQTLILLPQSENPTVTYTLDELRTKRKECVPNLTTISCGNTFPFVNGLRDDCASVGIDLIYH